MSKALITESLLTAIANAIRGKNGSSDNYTPAQMAAAIDAIPTGGGGGGVPEKYINFIDYDGTIVASYDRSELPLAALPAVPDHSQDDVPLINGKWNWTLADINAANAPLDVGATYSYDGYKAYMLVEVEAGYTFTLGVTTITGNQSYQIVINWGDGDTTTLTNTGSSQTTTHTYASAGEYLISVSGTPSAQGSVPAANYWCDVYPSARNTSSYSPSTTTDSIRVKKMYISNAGQPVRNCGTIWYADAVLIPNSNFKYNSSVKTDAVALQQYSFYYCEKVNTIVLPYNTLGNDTYIFANCYLLKHVCLPPNITYVGTNWFSNAANLERVTIPASVTELTRSFSNCPNLREMHLLRTTPPTISNTFTNLPPSLKIYVPYSSDHSVLAAYRAASNWSVYASQMVEEPAPSA